MTKIEQVKKFTGSKIYDSIISSYPRSTQLILNGGYDELENLFPRVLATIKTCVYNADSRKLSEYAENIALAWVMEDFARLLVEKHTGVKLLNDGGDSNRQFLSRNYVSSRADFKTTDKEGNEVLIEFTTDYAGHMRRTNKFALRNKKLPGLLRHAKAGKVMILNLDLINNSFFLQDVETFNYRETVAWGKPSFEVDLDFPVYKITKENLIDQFNIANC